MKKYLTLLLILSLVIFAGCAGKKDNQDENKVVVEPPRQEESKNNEQKDPIKGKDELQSSKIVQFPEAAQGEFTDLPIKFDDSREKVVKVMGTPDEITTWQGSELYIYNNVGIFIDPSEEKVTGLTAGEGYKTYGVKIGMSPEEIKNILGKPDNEGENLESGAYVLEYEAGDYVVEFALHPDTKISAGVTLYRYNY